MKATTGKKQQYITITPKPTKNIPNGLRVYFSSDYATKNYELPIATTDIILGKRRYRLPRNDFMKVIKIEIC